MRKTITLLSMFLFLGALVTLGQASKPDSAHTILKTAVDEARSSKKNVFLIFHATWCVWCKRLEAVLENPAIKTLLDKNYVIVKLDVKERGDKIQTHENPGGQKILANFGGSKSGLPFMAFLNRKGFMIANSNVMPKKQNIGYPGSTQEITAFIKLLKQTAPRMTDEDRDIISRYLEKNTPQ